MKTAALSIVTICLLTQSLYAQKGAGGFPLSTQRPLSIPETPVTYAPLPDWEKAQTENKRLSDAGLITPFKVGLFSATDIRFPESGSLTTLDNGSTVWRAQLQIDGAPAIGLYYDQFYLPKGVSLFISNQTGSQILGAYTDAQNAGDGSFAEEAVVGGKLNLELNIAPGVDLKRIQLHVNRALVYFNSISYLDQYLIDDKGIAAKPTGADTDQFDLQGSSSTCEIDATCPLANGHEVQRKATVQLIIPVDSTSAEACTATLINNTGNSTAQCVPYLLTATHCDPNNYSTTDHLPFNNMLVRFNFEKSSCNTTEKATVNTLKGVVLKARSNFANQNSINGDFMLFNLKESIPDDWDAYLAGWNRADSNASVLPNGQKYFDFNHPAADVKKITTFQTVLPNGDANAAVGSHWSVTTDQGFLEQGSSGSSLFDGNGRSIGIASIAFNPSATCTVTGKGTPAQAYAGAAFSKISNDWNYSVDGTDSNRRLQPWLDPAHTGVITLNAVHANCSAIATTGIRSTQNNALQQSINIYPNPATTGVFRAAFHLADAADIELGIYNVTGSKLATYVLKHVTNDTYVFDVSQYSNGLYLLQFNDGSNIASKKIIVAK